MQAGECVGMGEVPAKLQKEEGVRMEGGCGMQAIQKRL